MKDESGTRHCSGTCASCLECSANRRIIRQGQMTLFAQAYDGRWVYWHEVLALRREKINHELSEKSPFIH